MGNLKFVCVSDLHLGAPDSVLTELHADGTVNAAVSCATLRSFATALRATLTALRSEGAPLPTLVLLGDILDLGLSPMGQVSDVFKQFVQHLFVKDAEPVFAPKLLIIPGNHDHHLWRMAQDGHYLDSLEQGVVLPDLINHNRFSEKLPGSELNCRMLTALLRQVTGDQDSAVHIAYPNFSILEPQTGRAVVMHHGHYIDPTYRLMSTLFQSLNDLGDAQLTAEEMERQNGAWVDFLWSDLGSAGVIGREAFSLYQLMGSASAAHAYAKKFSDQIEHKLFSSIGISGSTPLYKGITAGQLVQVAVEALLTRFAEGQRNNYLDVLPAGDLKDLVTYLRGPVKADLVHALAESGQAHPKPEDMAVSFIFGHTHKPFEREVLVDGFAKPLAVYNTGGWVMDQPTGSFTQGASAMFIDADLNIAALRLFNDPVNESMQGVEVHDLAHEGGGPNAMVQALAQAVRHCQAPWDRFTADAQAKLQMQADLLLAL